MTKEKEREREDGIYSAEIKGINLQKWNLKFGGASPPNPLESVGSQL